MKVEFKSTGINIELKDATTHAIFSEGQLSLSITPVIDFNGETKICFGFGVLDSNMNDHHYHTSGYYTLDEAVEKIFGQKPFYPKPIEEPEMEAHSLSITYRSSGDDEYEVIDAAIDGIELDILVSHDDGMDTSIILRRPYTIEEYLDVQIVRYHGRSISLTLEGIGGNRQNVSLYPGIPDDEYGHGNKPIYSTKHAQTFLWYFELPV